MITKTNIEGLFVIEPRVFEDERGYFFESFNQKQFEELVTGKPTQFVQDNHSRSQKGVLRGLHLQKSRPQGKLVSCSAGAVFDVAVDVNPESPTFGQYVGLELSADNHKQLWIPPGYAHGFCVLTETADFQYKCTDLYFPEDEGGLIWNDPDVDIDWPIKNPLLSDKDLKLPTLAEIKLGV